MPTASWTIFFTFILGTLVLAGCQFVSASHPPARPLREWGTIAIPKRLELRQQSSNHQSYELIHFERVANSIFLIGSSTPIAEKLILAAWTTNARVAARQAAIELAQDRIGKLTWLTPEIAEGIHEVNTAKHPAWLVVTEVPTQGLTLAYMVWKKDAPPTAAETLARAQSFAQSFKPSMTAEEYLKVAMDRPAHQRTKHMQAVEAALATRNIHLKLDTGPIETDGAIYELYTREPQGRLLTVLLPLGTLPAQAGYKRLQSDSPDIQYFSTRDHNGIDDRKLLLSQRTIAKALSTDPQTVKFYTASAYLLDDLEMPEPDLDYLWKAHAKMRPLFAQGKLIQ
jgi:hypothetical protein